MSTAINTTTPAISPAPAFECGTDRATLVRALTTVGAGVPRRPAVPLLGGVLLEGEDGQLVLTTTDYDTTVSVRVPDAVCTPGRLLVDHTEAAKLLAALVKGTRKRDADTAPVTIRAAVGGTGVLELGGYAMPLTTYPAEDFPTVPEVPPTVAEVNRERFVTDARRVLIAAGTDDARPTFTGMHLQARPGTLTLAATDRFRLAVAELPATTPATDGRAALFPARVLAAVLKHCHGDRMRPGLDPSAGWVSLSCGALTVLTRPVEAPDFPRYEGLFPDATVTVTVDRDTSAQATTRAAAAGEAKKHTTQDRDHGPEQVGCDCRTRRTGADRRPCWASTPRR